MFQIARRADDPNGNLEAALGWELFSDGTGCDAIIVPGGGSKNPASAETVANEMHYIQMLGSDVYRYATRQLAESGLAALRNAGLTAADIDQFVFHQANLRIIRSVEKALGIPEEKDFVNIEKYGNT